MIFKSNFFDSSPIATNLFQRKLNETLFFLFQVQDKYRYVEQRRLMLLKHCAEGYENNLWIFDEEQDHLTQNVCESTKK